MSSLKISGKCSGLSASEDRVGPETRLMMGKLVWLGLMAGVEGRKVGAVALFCDSGMVVACPAWEERTP